MHVLYAISFSNLIRIRLDSEVWITYNATLYPPRKQVSIRRLFIRIFHGMTLSGLLLITSVTHWRFIYPIVGGNGRSCLHPCFRKSSCFVFDKNVFVMKYKRIWFASFYSSNFPFLPPEQRCSVSKKKKREQGFKEQLRKALKMPGENSFFWIYFILIRTFSIYVLLFRFAMYKQ